MHYIFIPFLWQNWAAEVYEPQMMENLVGNWLIEKLFQMIVKKIGDKVQT